MLQWLTLNSPEGHMNELKSDRLEMSVVYDAVFSDYSGRELRKF